MSYEENQGLLARLSADLDELQEVDITTMSPADQLRFAAAIEVLQRRLAHGADRVTGQLDATAAFSLDGHRNVRNAVKHLGRLTGAEALGRTQTIRAMQLLPLVDAAYAAGALPVGHVRLIARVAANPRVHQHLEAADALFVDQARALEYDEFRAWIQQWLFLADPDGADRDDEITHEKRRGSLVENFDGSWTLQGQFGALQGSVANEILEQFEQAEFEADWAWAREMYGPNATADQLPRTPAQRRADAIIAALTWAASAPADGRRPEPSVSIVVGQDTFETELRRACGEDVEIDPNEAVEGRVCHTMAGTLLHPSDVLAAAMAGFVRRVVVDAAGTVIDLGRRRRLFTGSSREAAMLQAFLRSPGGLGCLWPGCDGGARHVDHHEPAARGGPTDVANSRLYCGTHNRLKETGFKPVRAPDGTWTMHRPDGTPITPSA